MSEFVHVPELSIFEHPKPISGIDKAQYIDFRPVAPVTDDSVIEFNVLGNGSQYLNLRDTRLHAKLLITKADGSTLTEEDAVGFIALPLHSCFKQVDVYLNHENVSPGANLYPYKTYLEKLLNQSTAPGHPHAASELYILDGNPEMGESNNLSESNPNTETEGALNKGLHERAKYTNLGRIIDLESSLYCDVTLQERFILNSVDMRVRLYQTPDAFRLMTSSEEKYKVKIVDIYLRVSKVSVSPETILAHNQALLIKPAVYPYWKSTLKAFSVAKGGYTVNIEDPFQGRIPAKLFCFFVSSEAFNGSYKKNPLEFRHYDLRSAGFFVNGLSVPNQPQEMNFNHRDVVTAFNSLLETAGKADVNAECDISLDRFVDGFTILGFNLETSLMNTLDFVVPSKDAHSRLELRFGTPIPEAINVITMAVYPQLLHIDHARNVTIE